jgi:uncharacterized protein YndB with AHSA1/START domain
MQRIEKQVIIDAPRSVVWAALTDPASIRQWMGGAELGIEFSTDWTVGGPLLITGFHHVAFQNRGMILRFEPEQTLCYTHLDSLSRLPDEPQSYSTLCFTLATVPQTALTLTIDNFPTEAIYKHLNFYWGTTLEVLKRFVERHPANGDA